MHRKALCALIQLEFYARNAENQIMKADFLFCAGSRTAAAVLFLCAQAASAQTYVERLSEAEYEEMRNPGIYVPYSDLEMEREAMMAAAANGHVSPENAVMAASCFVNWTDGTFSSDVSLDVEKASIPMPGGKATAVKEIEMKLPILAKDPLLSLYVDDAKNLGDLVLEGSITLEDLTRIVDSSKKTPAVFASGGVNLLTRHTIKLTDIASSLIKHKTPYENPQPIEHVSSREYTGIIIDARGQLPIHGEFTESEAYPCLFPKIWTEDMDLLYERNMVKSDIARTQGIVHYASSEFTEDYADRTGNSPLWITAKKVYGINRCDPIISRSDYLRIVSVKQNIELLKQGKVVILLDKKNLEHTVEVPLKEKSYYITYHQLKRFFFERKIPDIDLEDVLKGIQITVQNLQFIADSYELLPEEKPRIAEIAQSLKKAVSSGEYTILIEGHTADVNKPNGQMTLSVQRAQEIIKELSANGLDKSLFTFRGFGGTKPVADNSTPEGRALNRRVEIIIMPKGSYILRE